MRRAQEQVFPGFLRAAARRDDKRHVRALGDLERAVVEGQQLAGLAAGALGVDADAADIPLEVIHRREDGLDRLPVVVAVDRQEAGAGHDAPHHEETQILRLGDIGEVVLAQRVELGDRIEGRAVVDHHQKAPVLRQLFKPAYVRVHAGEEADHVSALRNEEAADRVLRLPRPARVDEKRNNQREKQKQRAQAQHAAHEDQRAFPKAGDADRGGKAVAHRAEQRQDHNDSHQHGDMPSG